MNQSYPDFELIIIDDGSVDNTEAVINLLKKEDSRIKYLRHEINKGQAAARNTGICHASGRYIAFQDSDDEWVSEKLERQINLFCEAPGDVGVVYTGFLRKFIDGRNIYYPSEKVNNKEGYIYYELLNGNFVGLPTALIKKECFSEIGLFDKTIPALEDWELFIRISRKFKFLLINEPLVMDYESINSISKDRSANIRALMLIIQRHKQDFIKNKKALARYYFQIGDYLFRNGQFKEGRLYFKKAFCLKPLRSKPFLAFMLSFTGKDIYRRLL